MSATVKVMVLWTVVLCRRFLAAHPSMSISGISATYTGLLLSRLVLVVRERLKNHENVAERGEGPRSIAIVLGLSRG